ncbi:MAG TPA: acetoacetate decarboxylase family protein [Candidatus Binataceae bacterium]|nr:acetoacetate decarboxylase family protein [Candidatus Binataceae bacterium]
MPDEGLARHEQYRITLPAERTAYPPLPWKCANATMLNVYFEVRKAPMLERLPPEYCRTSPAYCRLTIIDCADSPAGPFRDATLGLGARLNMLPAVFVAASITDNRHALSAGLRERSYPNVLGKIEFEAGVARAHAIISDAKGPLLELEMPQLQTIEPSRLAYDHADGIRTLEDGGTELMVVGPEMTIERAAICKNATITYPAERPDSPWQILDCRNVVSAQVVHGAREFKAGHQPR